MATPQVPRVIKTDKPTARATQPSTQYPWQQPGFTPRPPTRQQVPNYERLTATERWVMNRLPGIAESGVGRALEWFGNTWAGRALQYLDIGAEGVERGIGFVAQALDANAHGQEAWDDFQANAREAWYAGSLAADFVGSPTGDMVPYTVAGGGVGAVGGAVLGSLGGPIGTFAGGLLGAGAGTGIGLAFQMGENGHESVASLVESRRQIADLVRQGMDPGDALVQVRDQMYESQGALALRSQMNDLWVHLFADPINIVAEFIKPIEALEVRRILALRRAMPDEVVESIRVTETLLDEARGALRVAQGGAAEVAGAAPRVAGEVLEEVAGAAPRVAATAEEIAAKAETVAGLENSLRLLREATQMSPWQQAVLRIAGNMDWPTDSAVGRFLNSRAGRLITGPFRLTRESRAYAFVDTIETNLRAYLPRDFQEAMRDVLRARDGIYSPQIAHMVVTAEGRYVRGMMSGLGAVAERLLQARVAAMPDRRILEFMSVVLGEDVYRVLAQAGSEAPALFRRFNEALAQVPDGQRILAQTLRIGNRQIGDFTADLLKGIHGTLEGTGTITDDLLRTGFLNAAADIAAQAGIAKFGVRARGTLLAAADAIKAAESLALLRAGNVVYPLRNWVNNVVTMIARGTYVGGSREAIADVERILGGMPTRMRSGYGMAGLAGNEGLSAAESIIARASRGERGFWNQARDWISGIHFPGDTGAWARRIEVSASQRAYASGFHRFFRQGRRALLQNLEDFAPDVANSIRARYGDEALRAANNAIRGAGTDDDILRALASTDNMHLNLENILDSASERMGVDLPNILDETFTARWGPEIERAARAGPNQIEEVFERMWGEVQDELDNRLDDSLRTLTEEATERIVAEGPGSFPGVFGDAIDEFHGSYVQGHAMTMARIGDLTDLRPEVANRMMGAVLDREQRFMNRGWSRLEARMQGVANALGRREIRGGAEVMTAFRQWRDGWRQFFEWRNTTWREFFDARGAGRTPSLSFEEIRAQIARRYDDVIAMEADRLSAIDRLTGSMIPENLRPTFFASRDRVAALRAQRADMLREWFAQVDAIPYNQRQAAFAGFWRRMMDNTSAVSVEQKIGSRAAAGNAEAAATYQDDLIAASVRAEEAVRGTPLSTAEQRQIVLDRLAQYGRPQEEADLVMGRLRQVARPPEPTAGRLRPPAAPTAAAPRETLESRLRPAVEAGGIPGTMVGSEVEILGGRYAGRRATITRQTYADGVMEYGLDVGEPNVVFSTTWDNVAFPTAAGVPIEPRVSQRSLPGALAPFGTTSEEEIAGVLRGDRPFAFFGGQGFGQLPENLPGGVSVTRNIVNFGGNPVDIVYRTDAQNATEMRQLISELRRIDQIYGPIERGEALGRLFGYSEADVSFWASNMRRQTVGVPMDAEQIAAQAGVMTDAQRSAIAAQDLTTIEHARPIVAAMPPAQRQAWLVRESESSLAIGLQEGWITARELNETRAGHRLNNVFVTRGGWIRWGFEELNGEQVPVLTFIRGRRPGGSDVLRSWMRHNDVAGHRMFLTNELLADTVNEAGETVTRGDTFFRRMVREGAVTRLRDLPPVSGEQRILFRMGGEAEEAAHLPDFHAFVPRQLYMDTGLDQLWYLRGQQAVESIRDAALDLQRRPPLRFSDLSEAEQQTLQRWMSQSQVQLAQARYMGMRGAEFMRDSSLLNYNRRHNYNTFLGTIMPYEFWFTQSALNWALHSIDRPEMLMIYLRMQQFLNTAYRPEQNLPARLRGQIRIPMPFLPNWMGDSIFVDPMRFALPLDQFTYPFEQYQQQQQRDEGATTRVLEQLLNDGQIDQAAYQEALQTRQGTTWDRAQALARQDDDEERLSAFDFMSLFSSPHVPIQWAYNAARGTPERIGTLLPLTRSIRGVTAALGIGPAGGVNIEGNIRRELGLPEFDRWDDYRIDRMLSNMVATGEITLQQEREAMTSREGEVFDLAEHRAVQEISGGPGLLGIARSVFGIPIRAYPPGEEHLRELRDEYAQAWQEYDGGDMQAVNRFFEAHPEYEARVDLGYWNKPEERIRRFAVDEIWDTWNSLPQLHQNEVSEQLGPMFQNAFLSRETRSYESIPNEMLVAWTRVMRGDPPGTLSTGPGWQIPPLDLAPRDVAYRADAFYQSRDAYFPQWRDLQSDYYLLDEGAARREYLRAHPPYAQYRAWRTDWFMRNPDVVPYLTDRPEDYTYPSEQALREAQAGQPSLQPAEWYQVLGPNIWALLDDNQNGEPLPEVARRRLQEIADQYGTTVDHILSDIAQGLAQTQ